MPPTGSAERDFPMQDGQGLGKLGRDPDIHDNDTCSTLCQHVDSRAAAREVPRAVTSDGYAETPCLRHTVIGGHGHNSPAGQSRAGSAGDAGHLSGQPLQPSQTARWLGEQI